MLKIIMMLLLLFCALFAKDYTLSSEYKISYGYFGTIGVAKADLIVENGTYKIKVKAKTTGLVGVLTRHRVEVFESTGIVENGLFVPDIFIESKKRGGKVDTKRYIFDHKQSIINLYSSKKDEDSKGNKRTILSFYSKNDILTLFFNLNYYLNKDLNTKDTISLVAVGANKRDGKIDIRNIENNQKDILNFFKHPNHLLSVILNKRIFASKNGEMYIDLNNDGVCTSAILKDVLMFGDIRGKMISLKKEDLN